MQTFCSHSANRDSHQPSCAGQQQYKYFQQQKKQSPVLKVLGICEVHIFWYFRSVLEECQSTSTVTYPKSFQWQAIVLHCSHCCAQRYALKNNHNTGTGTCTLTRIVPENQHFWLQEFSSLCNGLGTKLTPVVENPHSTALAI
eukprot:scpid58412/ scgid11406/ 